METTNQLYIFKTDIKELCPNCEVYKTLSKHAEILHWSLDSDDADCVLRITSSSLTPQQIIAIISAHGHECSELN